LFIAPSAPPGQSWNAPAYVDPAKFTNVDVTVGPTALGGTLSLPKMADKQGSGGGAYPRLGPQ
jgi:hypothetical protein